MLNEYRKDRLIKVSWGKAVLFLTPEEIKEALRRGKAIMRNQNFSERLKKENPFYKCKRERI